MRRALAGAIALALSVPASADTLIDNVDGLTLSVTGAVQRFSGVLIDDNGRVAQLFQRGEKRPLRVDYRLDGKGRVLMPGLIDSHVALMPLALSRSAPAAPGAKPRPEDRDQALIDVQKLLLERGITTVVDMGTTIEDWQAYRRAGDAGTLALRIIGYGASAEDMVLIAGPRPTPWLYDDRLRLVGLSIAFASAAPPAPARPARATPARPLPRGPEPVIQLKNLLSRAGIDGFQPAVAVRDAASLPPLLDAIGELAQTYKGERRWRVDLGFTPAKPELDRMKLAGMAIVMLPSALADPAAALPMLTPDAVRMRMSFGAGPALTLPTPLARLGEVSPRETALAAMTADAAWTAFADGKFGRIAIGQRADLILIERDPLLASIGELREMKVLQTWVGGRMVYRAAEEAAPNPQQGPQPGQPTRPLPER